MSGKRTIEVFSAGCPICRNAVEQIKDIACPSCEITVLDMNDPAVGKRAKQLGIMSVPAVAVNGKLAACCSLRGINLEVLTRAGVGTPEKRIS